MISYERVVDRGFKYISIAPALVVVVALTLFPFVVLLFLLFHNVQLSQGRVLFESVGFRNISQIFSDSLFVTSVINTLIFTFFSVVIEAILGFLLALIAFRLALGTNTFRVLITIPIMVPPVAIGSMWRLMYNPDFGIVNRFLSLFHIGPVPFLSSVSLALPSVIAVDIWHWTPFVFLLCLAGLQGLPGEVIEAATVDGAGTWTMLRSIVVPLMLPTLGVVLMFRTVFAFKVFDEIFLLTSGGPGTATEVASLYTYDVFFQQSRMGYGAVVSVATIGIVTVMLILFRTVTRRSNGA